MTAMATALDILAIAAHRDDVEQITGKAGIRIIAQPRSWDTRRASWRGWRSWRWSKHSAVSTQHSAKSKLKTWGLL